MKRSTKIVIPVVAFAVVMLFVTAWLGAPDYSSTFSVNATWHPDRGEVVIMYNDASLLTESVTLEVLGLAETFQKVRAESSFVETLEFDGVPKHGWRAHPVVFDVTHTELGNITIKTEVYGPGDPPSNTIYGKAS